MANKITSTTKNISTGILTFNQDYGDIGSDGRTWSDLNGNIFYITDDLKIAKQESDGTVTTSDAISTHSNLTKNITLAINKGRDVIYVLHHHGDRDLYLMSMDINTMIFGVGVPITNSSSNNNSPISMVITKEPDPKILVTCIDGVMYKCDLDGGNISSVISHHSNHRMIFSVSANNIGMRCNIYNLILFNTNLDEIFTLDMSNEGIGSFNANYTMIDSFIVDEIGYFLCGYDNRGSDIFLVKVDLVAQTILQFRNLQTDFSMTRDIVKLFTDGTYGYITTNDDGTNRKMYQVTLSDLNCISLKQHDQATNQFKFTETGLEQTIVSVMGSSGDDPAGFMVSGKGVTGAS